MVKRYKLEGISGLITNQGLKHTLNDWIRPQDYSSADTLFYTVNRICANIGKSIFINFKQCLILFYYLVFFMKSSKDKRYVFVFIGSSEKIGSDDQNKNNELINTN